MATYLIQFNFTERGMQHIKESPARVEAAKEEVRKLGGEVKAFYAILGSEFDTMFIIEAPNEQKAGEIALAIGARGYVRSRTHRLFSENEFRSIVTAVE